jgi:hypothetical protein
MTLDPLQDGAAPTRIRDIPKIKEALRQIDAMASIKMALPLLKPFMRLLGVDSTGIATSLQDVEKLRADIEELSTIPDDFNDLLSERGWIIYDHLNLDVAKKAVALAKSNDLDGAEAQLVAYFNVDEIRRQLRLLNAVTAFHSRMRLAHLAADDHAAGRFHASVPVLLALMDGLVSEISENQRGFFATDVDLRAWDSISAHDKGLNAISRIFQKTRRKTTTEPINVPYRHGILHGRDLSYDNELVATKTWAALFAVRDWAVLAERGQLDAPAPQPDPGIVDTLRKWHDVQERKKQLAAWTPRIVRVGETMPVSGSPDAYLEGTPERHVVSFLNAWQRGNYGHMARDAGTAWKGAGSPTAADMRAAFQFKRLGGFELLSVEDQAAAVSLVTVKRIFKNDDGSTVDTLTYRLIRVDSDHEMAARTVPGTTWAIINWNW